MLVHCLDCFDLPSCIWSVGSYKIAYTVRNLFLTAMLMGTVPILAFAIKLLKLIISFIASQVSCYQKLISLKLVLQFLTI